MTMVPNFNTEYVGVHASGALPVIAWHFRLSGVVGITPAGETSVVIFRNALVIEGGQIRTVGAYLRASKSEVAR